ncbi:protein of unknown function UPF0118 [Clostridium cellulovorans 743B]|uniref:Permease n=2 Tax=Clostridium cellulovorans TaxID=1493 RepID=D9SMA1_CLOC7|nr:protein of unknown function UPF0118 [Clostridium cellulovorans 743B]
MCSKMILDKKSIYKIAGLLVFAITFYFCVNNFDAVLGVLSYCYTLLLPFILGGCIAFILNIPMNYFSNKFSRVQGNKLGSLVRKGNKIFSLILSFVLVLGVIILVLALVIPQIAETAKRLPTTFENASVIVKSWIENVDWLSNDIINKINVIEIDWNSVFNEIKSSVFNGAGSMISSTIGVATSFLNGVVNFSLGLVFSIYLLLDKENLSKQCKKILYAFLPKEKVVSILEIASLANKTFSNFLTGQCVEAVILGFLFFVTMSILHFPYAMVVSVFIACTALIPVFGAFIGGGLGFFLIVMDNPTKALLFLVLFLVLQQIEGNLIYPRVVGNSVGLPSMWVLVAITLGGKLMGLTGMLIFIPLCSVAYVLFRKAVNNKLYKKKIIVE